jgi:predicted alpha/beta-fold hydrolase
MTTLGSPAAAAAASATHAAPTQRRSSVTRTTDTDLPFLESFWWCACLAGAISAVGVVETAAGVRFGLASAASLVWIVMLASAARWYLKIARPIITRAPNSVFALDGTLTNAMHGGMCPSLSDPKPIVPPPWAFDSSFQMLYFLIRNALCMRAVRFRDERVPCPRGGPPLILSWAENNPTMPLPGCAAGDSDAAPILLMLHGLMCDANDLPGTSFIHTAVRRGWKVVVWNRPGHRVPLETPRFSLFGDYRDLDAVVGHIKLRYPNRTLGAIGFSAGCYPALRYLGERGEASAIDATVMISGGLSVDDSMYKCGWFFAACFVSKAKGFFLRANEAVLRAHDNDGYERALAAGTTSEFLRALSPFMCDTGAWPDAKRIIDPLPTMGNIQSPCLFINALDDPIVPVESVDPYMDTFFKRNRNVLLAQTVTGSHCPFLDGFGGDDWSLKASFEFLAHQCRIRQLRRNAKAAAEAGRVRSPAASPVGK